MKLHIHDETMLRNGCLTLCQFRIPQDIVSIGHQYYENFYVFVETELLMEERLLLLTPTTPTDNLQLGSSEDPSLIMDATFKGGYRRVK